MSRFIIPHIALPNEKRDSPGRALMNCAQLECANIMADYGLAPKIMVAFCPPRPKLFDKTYRSPLASLATLGT